MIHLDNLISRLDFRNGINQNFAKFRTIRSVQDTGAIIQGDDNTLIIFNKPTAFDFTLDQLTVTSKVSFINYGAGAVTFIPGTGVTITGETILPGAIGTEYPSALVIYDTPTTPRILTGNANRLTLETVITTGGTITLDFGNKIERMFVGSASFNSSKTIALSNSSHARVLNLVLNITSPSGTVVFPSTFTAEAVDERWNDTTHTFTPVSGGKHEFSATWDGTDWNLKVSYPYS